MDKFVEKWEPTGLLDGIVNKIGLAVALNEASRMLLAEDPVQPEVAANKILLDIVKSYRNIEKLTTNMLGEQMKRESITVDKYQEQDDVNLNLLKKINELIDSNFRLTNRVTQLEKDLKYVLNSDYHGC